jgi:hypothetical protein
VEPPLVSVHVTSVTLAVRGTAMLHDTDPLVSPGLVPMWMWDAVMASGTLKVFRVTFTMPAASSTTFTCAMA